MIYEEIYSESMEQNDLQNLVTYKENFAYSKTNIKVSIRKQGGSIMCVYT